MVKGITYGGEIAEVGSGTLPQDIVEFACSDPRFLERASAKKPNFVVRFFSGAYSYPRDWWCGIFYCMMQLGIFGAEAKSQSDVWRRDLNTILIFARNNPSLAARLLVIYFRHKSTEPEMYGRLAGGFFTSYASSGGRFGMRALGSVGATTRNTYRVASFSRNFILSNTGAAVLAVKYGGRDIINIFDAMITGRYTPNVSGEQYKVLFQSAIDSGLTIPPDEADALVALVEAVLDCLNNPEKFAGDITDERPVTPHVPVGTVSSARLRGQHGSIPRGYETNALDAISDQNRLNSR